MRFRVLLAVLAVAVPIETLAWFLLQNAPHMRVPGESRLWLRQACDMAALFHAPGILLADFLCRKFCPPSAVLQVVIVAGGYVDTLLLLWFFYAVVQMWKPESTR